MRKKSGRPTRFSLGVAVLLLAPGVFAQPATARTTEITVRACIAGTDDLIIRGKRMFWQNIDKTPVGQAAPPAEDCRRTATPTTVTSWDGIAPTMVEWNPVYVGATSKEFDGVADGLPEVGDDNAYHMELHLFQAEGRGSVSWIQRPNRINNFTAEIRFTNENGTSGADWHTAEIDIFYHRPHTPGTGHGPSKAPPHNPGGGGGGGGGVPEPSTVAIFAVGLAVLSTRRRNAVR
jgi:hypothetical protein